VILAKNHAISMIFVLSPTGSKGGYATGRSSNEEVVMKLDKIRFVWDYEVKL
jgi:hypothetical protein